MDIKTLNRILHSQWMLMLVAVLTVVAAVSAYIVAPTPANPTNWGILFPSPNLWIGNPVVAMVVNVLFTLGLAAMIMTLNRTYNLLTSPTLLDATIFLSMCAAAPTLLMHFTTGTVLCAVVMLCLFVLFSAYGQTHATRSIFLIFLLLSAMTMTQYAFLFYIPVFVIGVAQMRILTGRTVVAALLGLATPWWIVFGLGIVSPADVHLPGWEHFLNFSLRNNAWLFGTVAVTAALMVVAWMGNFPAMIAYNAHRRAYNGTMSLLSLVTLLVVCLDLGDIAAYAPMLMMCAAGQSGKFLAGHLNNFGFSAGLSIILIYFIISACYPISHLLL